MRLGLAHEIGFGLAMLASILIVLFGGELPGFAWLVCLAPPVSAALSLRGTSAPALSATLVGIASVVFGVVTVVRGGIETSVLAGAEVLMGLVCARLLVRRTPAHDLQAVLLSLLLVLAGSVLNVGINYIAVFVVYAISVVWALSTRQLLAGARDADRERVRARTDVVTPSFFAATGFISLAVLLSAAVIFAAFPRVGFGDIGAFLKKDSKLPSAVGLRGDPRLGGGTNVVARVRGVPREAFDRGLYLRGAVYDVVNLDGFSQSPQPASGRSPTSIELAEPPQQGRYEVTVTPVVGDTLVTLGGATAVRALSGGAVNPNIVVGVAGKSPWDELKALGPVQSPLRYEVAGGFAAPSYVPKSPRRTSRPLSDDDRARLTALPPGFDDALAKVARDAVGTATSTADKAEALRVFFFSRFVYSQTPPRFASAPLRAFLLEDHQGHCEFFASAFALLLRSQGIPARVVGGFQGGAWDDGVVVFQERHAHAWVEWWADGVGWIVDDATPLATAPREELATFASLVDRVRRFWDDQVIDYSLQDQSDRLTQARRAWRSVSPQAKALGLGLAVPVVLALLVLVALRVRRRTRAKGGAHPLAAAIVDAVSRTTQRPVPASWTVREAVAAAPSDNALAHALRAALAAYERERFGGGRVGDLEVGRHRRALKAAVRNHPRASAPPR
jgi:transglutaminase-like putative cysteine protease